MSRERFDWLQQWVADPADIIRTPGTESNVKEIYDKCAELARDPENVILNQFSEFANYLIHYHCTGPGVRPRVRRTLEDQPIADYSAGGLRLGHRLGRDDRRRRSSEGACTASKIAAVEALECPTMLLQRLRRAQHPGHRRQAHSADPQRHEHRRRDRRVGRAPATRSTSCSAARSAARISPARRQLDPELVRQFDDIGISGLANIVAAIKLAKHLDYGPDDVVMTVATDSADAVRQRAADLCRAALSARVRRGQCRRDVRPPPRRRRRRPRARARPRRPHAHLQSRLLHLGRAAGRRASRISIGARDQRFWRGLVDSDSRMGPADRGVQRRGRRVADASGLVRADEARDHERGATVRASCERNLAERDRSLREKVVSLEEAASFVRRRRRGRHRRQHDVAHADGHDLGADSRRQEEAVVLARHRVERRRPAVRLRRVRPHGHQLVQPGHPVGRLQGDAPLRRDREGALRRMEPSGDRHALPRRRHGRAVHADPLDAGFRRAGAASRGGRDGLPVHAGEAAARPGAQSGRRADPRAARAMPTATRRSTACSSWTSIWRWPPTGSS